MDFKLPDIGEGVAEGEIVKWMVKEGEAVNEDQPMVSVMTDKATVEITAPATGRIGKILAAEGQTVPVGATIVVIETAAGVSVPTIPSHGSAHSPVGSSNGGGRSATPNEAARDETPRVEGPVASRTVPVPGLPGGLQKTVEAARPRALASPATRQLARTLGLEITHVAGSGPHGRVTSADVQSVASGGASRTAAAPAPAGPTAPLPGAVPVPQPVPARTAAQSLEPGPLEERIPIRGLRKRIAEKMTRSKQLIPHFSYVDEVEMTDVVRLREQMKPTAEARGVKLTYLPFVIQALIPALRKFPYLNASLDDAKQEIVLKRQYNIGIATATPEGLTVTVVHDADRKSLLDLAKDLQDLTSRARAGKSTMADVTGSTFTITSAGSIGGLMAMPIINHPEVAILGVFKLQDRAVVRDGQVVARAMMNLSISLDHRVVDGAVAAEFMNELIANLQQPGRILADLR